jgi:hypothetical protein
MTKNGTNITQAFEIFSASEGIEIAKKIVSLIIDAEESESNPRNSFWEMTEADILNASKTYASQRIIEKLILSEKFNIQLVKAIVFQIPVKHPLKQKWIGIIEDSGLTVSKNCSKLLYFFYKLKMILWELKNFLLNLEVLFSINSILQLNSCSRNFSFVLGMHPVTISQQVPDESLHTFKNWFNVFNKDSSSHLSFLEVGAIKLANIIKSVWYFRLFLKLMVSLFLKGEFKLFFQFLNVIRAWQIINLLISNRIIADSKVNFYFEGGYGITKELWMYKSVKANFSTNVVFTSVSIEPQMSHEMNHSIIKKYRIATWDKLLVIDSEHKDRLCDQGGYSPQNVQVVGPIFWADINHEILKDENLISVFDTEPQLDSFNLNRLYKYGYDNIQANLLFLSDVFELCDELRITVIHKSKRLLTHKRYPEYTEFFNQALDSYSSLRISPESVAASRVIMNCDLGTIAYPGSTTAVVAKYFGKASIYYDPLSSMRSFKEINGIPVIHSKSELREYLRGLRSNQNLLR